MVRRISKHKSRIFSSPKYLSLGAALLVAFLCVYLIFHKSSKPNNLSPSSSSNSSYINSQNSKATPSTTNSQTNKSQTATSPVTTETTGLVQPFGSFVSNHQPGTNGTPFDETSVCNTSPGAQCYIKFTQGEIVKALTERKADSNGSVSWSWNAKTLLGSGKWLVSAVSSLNDKNLITNDPTPLEIQ